MKLQMCRCFLPPGHAAFPCMVPPTILIAQHVSHICSLGNAEARAVHQIRACGAQTCQCRRRVTTSDLRLAIKTVRRKTKASGAQITDGAGRQFYCGSNSPAFTETHIHRHKCACTHTHCVRPDRGGTVARRHLGTNSV